MILRVDRACCIEESYHGLALCLGVACGVRIYVYVQGKISYCLAYVKPWAEVSDLCSVRARRTVPLCVYRNASWGNAERDRGPGAGFIGGCEIISQEARSRVHRSL
ncbi:MAG: hypothetical protein D3916_14215 [Candidatus Electrothrix sp. MAN1_4]|nr:hypothetical protein [Candidatus Electrothrix sp. MAN1_4]